MKRPSVTGFVLAGGRSSRMGCDKALLPLGPSSLIECAIERLRPHVERVVVIGNAHNIQHMQRLSVDAVITDCQSGYGPLMGLYTGLMSSRTTLNVFVSCDMPRIEPWVIERLLQAWCEEIDIVAFRAGPIHLQPFPIVCHTRAAVYLGRLLDRRQLALQELANLPTTRLLDLDTGVAGSMLMNVNTMADYHALCDDLSINAFLVEPHPATRQGGTPLPPSNGGDTPPTRTQSPTPGGEESGR